MEVFLNEGNGITLRTVTDPKGDYLIATDELKSKFKNFVKPKLDFAKGDIIETATEEDILNNRVIPEQVPLWCIKVILNEMGLTQAVNDALQQLEEPNKTRASFIWEYGNIIKRESQTVEFLGYVLQKSKTEIDTIFINANNIEL